MFRIYDKDNNNKLDEDELGQGLRKYGLNLTNEQVAQLFEVFDANKNGSIDYNEFLLKLAVINYKLPITSLHDLCYTYISNLFL